MFDDIKTHLQTLTEMKDDVPYPEENFIKAVYMAVRGLKQFTKACETWKWKSAGDRATEAQCWALFKEKYEIYDAEQDSLHDMSVANNTVMQEKLDQQTAKIKKWIWN